MMSWRCGRTAREAVERARDGDGPVLIEAKTMRMTGHAQHDAAEYVPREMFEYWKARDPLDRYEKLLSENRLWDEKTKAEIDARVEREMADDWRSPKARRSRRRNLPNEGVYCDGCHTVEADWQRPKEEVMPPQSSVTAAWTISDFGDVAAAGPNAETEDARTRSRQLDACLLLTYLEAIRQALLEEMDRDPAVVLLGEDIGVYGGAFKVTAGLLERFGWERVIDTPISETAIVGAAVGMSYLGLRPVAEMQFIDFIACAFNQITNYAAKSHYLLGRAGARWSFAGPRAAACTAAPFHSANPEMYFVHTPGLKVVYPATAYDAKGLLKSAIRDNNPVLFFEHKLLYRRVKEELPEEEYLVPLGKAAMRRARARSDHRELRGDGARVARSRRAAGRRRHRGRGGGPAHASAARPRDGPRIRAHEPISCWSCTRTRAPAASPERSRRW